MEKAMMAKANPGLPKAKKHSDNPILPALGNMSGGKKVRISCRVTFRMTKPIDPVIAITNAAAAPISPRLAGEMSMVFKVEKTRQGAPMVITSEEIRLVSYALPNLAQLQPMDTIINTGATTLNNNSIIALYHSFSCSG